MMLRRILPILFVFGSLFLFSCTKQDAPANNSSGPATTTPASTTTPVASTGGSGEKIGVPECDEYFDKMDTCLSKLSEAARGAVKTSLDTSRKAWHDAASTPQGKAGLAAACKQATEAAKKAYTTCTF
jgi:hypothetical protein